MKNKEQMTSNNIKNTEVNETNPCFNPIYFDKIQLCNYVLQFVLTIEILGFATLNLVTICKLLVVCNM